MKFTSGQIYFALFFVVIFTIGMIWSYLKDKKHQKYYYNNIWKVRIAIVLVIAIFATLAFWIHE